MPRRKNPFAKPAAKADKPAYAPPPPCPHGIRRSGVSHCQACEDEERIFFRTHAPAEMRLVESSTGRVVATYRIPKGLGPKTKGRRMGSRPKLSLFSPASASSADARPRCHLRLADRGGEVSIGYRTHPTAIERFAPTIELAMAEMLGADIGKPAILVWEGITAAAVRVREED